jgi:hypothetical protein
MDFGFPHLRYGDGRWVLGLPQIHAQEAFSADSGIPRRCGHIACQ